MPNIPEEQRRQTSKFSDMAYKKICKQHKIYISFSSPYRKPLNIKFHEIHPVGGEMFHANGWTDGWMDGWMGRWV
jgi:hypothetical protein